MFEQTFKNIDDILLKVESGKWKVENYTANETAYKTFLLYHWILELRVSICKMMHKIQILSIDKLDKYEGTVRFIINEKEYTAFFFGEDLEPGQYVEVEFDLLSHPLEWNVIFNENIGKDLKLEPSNVKEASYEGYGKIVAIDPVIAYFGDIRLNLGEWTHDPKVIGEFIYWKIDRLDMRILKGKS